MTAGQRPASRPTLHPIRKGAGASRSLQRAAQASGDELLGRAERIVTAAIARGADEAECFLQFGASLDVELEAGRIANTAASQGQGAGLRILKGGRLGFAYLTQDDQASIAAEQALRQARHGPKRNFHLPEGKKAKPLHGRWDDGIAALDVKTAIDLASDLLKEAKAAAPGAALSGGGAGLEAGWMAIASSRGVAAWDCSTSASCAVSLTLKQGERAVSASENQTRHDLAINPAGVALKAAETLLSLRKPKAPGKSRSCDVILRPEAATELVTSLAIGAATGDDARRGKTVWSEKLGASVAANHVDLVDDSAFPDAIGGSPFDGDGIPTQRLSILQGGVLRNFLYDSWDAHRHGAKSTASATRSGFKSRPETGTHHLVLSSRKARTMDKLLSGVDDGYLVDSVLGAHTANPTTGEFSVTAPNVWRIAAGAVVGPVSEIAIAGSLTSMLQNLDGVSKEAKAMSGARMPAVHIRNVAISS